MNPSNHQLALVPLVLCGEGRILHFSFIIQVKTLFLKTKPVYSLSVGRISSLEENGADH